MSPRHFVVRSHLINCQHIRGYPHATSESQEEELQLAVKQYIPHDNPQPQIGDVTIIACHAAGFFKELYEPFFDDLYEKLNPEVKIRSIWIADTASHGESSVINEGKLGNDPCWDDHARDLLSMINNFRFEMPRPLVGLGHSMGGTNIVQLALLHPRLFHTIICIEPIINKHHKGMNFAPAFALSYRKDVWFSRDQAAAELRKSPMHRTWDKRVMDLYIEYGLRDLPTLLYPKALPSMEQHIENSDDKTAVTLTTTKHHNVRSYARAAFPSVGQPLITFQPSRNWHIDLTKAEHEEMQAPIYRPEAILAFRQLPLLRPSCFYLYGASSPFSSATPQGRADKLKVTGVGVGGSGGVPAGMVEDVVLDGGGHFIVFEQPAALAGRIGPWLATALSRWKQEAEIEEEAWRNTGIRERAMVDNAWMVWVKDFYGGKGDALRKPKTKTKL